MSDSLTNISVTTETINNVLVSIGGINRTNGISPIGLIGRNNKREPAGFTPDVLFAPVEIVDNNDSWYGALLEAHPDYNGISSQYLYGSVKSTEKNDLSTSERFDQSKSYPNFRDDLPDSSNFFTTRDYYLLFNDRSTDYFRHGLHIIDNKTPLKSNKNTRETWDGSEEGVPYRLALFDNTPYENNDPVIFGFELIIDSYSSPLLNGSVEDFINQFSSISEVAARKYVLADFKEQFIKIFRTNGNIFIDQESNNQIKTSIISKGYPNDNSSSSFLFEGGRKAYMSYYLKKVTGLELLLETNSSNKKKYLVDYRTDVIKLTFNEDVSLTLGTLEHLYKLLFWSKPTGKNIIPDNLLRFNCDIIISEVRNLNRVRRAIDTGDLEVIKENVSRHVYSLKECQFWFDQPAHDTEIDLWDIKTFDNFTITMDYKYVTNKFERWVPDYKGFGEYVGYNNGAIWKIGNPGARDNSKKNVKAGTLEDNSNPKFFTAGENSLNQNGVAAPIVLQNYSYGSNKTSVIDNTPINSSSVATTSESAVADINKSETVRSEAGKSDIDKLKNSSKKMAQKLASNSSKIESSVMKSRIDIRAKLLNDSIDKIKANLYKTPFGEAGLHKLENDLLNPVLNRLKFTMPSGAPFKLGSLSDSITDFAGNSIGSILGNSKLFGK